MGDRLVWGFKEATNEEREDFIQFVEHRSGALFRTALFLSGNRHAAEDLVQEALERACRRWGRVRTSESPEAYVRRIMVNLANDRWRWLRRWGTPGEVPERADPGNAYQVVDERDALLRALQALPTGMRTVVVLYYFHDLDHRQIAADLGITESSARSQLSRALVKLRETLPGREPTHAVGGTAPPLAVLSKVRDDRDPAQ